MKKRLQLQALDERREKQRFKREGCGKQPVITTAKKKKHAVHLSHFNFVVMLENSFPAGFLQRP